MKGFGNDLRYAVRMLAKNRVFTLAAMAALALGVGANTAIFTVVNTVLLKPLSYPDANRLVEFGRRATSIGDFVSNVPQFEMYHRQTSVFDEVAAYDMGGPGFNMTGDRPEQLRGLHVTEGYFRLFGAPVALGRTFTPSEDTPGGGRIVVLSYNLWQRKFGGDAGVLGRTISLGNEAYTIVGVIGKDFDSDPAADIWLPFQFEPASRDPNSYFHVAGRLRAGVSLDQARAELNQAGLAEYRLMFPHINPRMRFAIEPLADSIVGDARRSLWVMLGAVGLVLLIACANVASLLLARATARRQEFAIRSALGAAPLRILRQLLIESVLLAVAGGAAGTALGLGGLRMLLAVSPAGLPRIGEHGGAVTVDWRVMSFTLGVSIFTGILFGIAPAFAGSRADVNLTLRDSGGRTGSAGSRRTKTRRLLVTGEIALALVLVVASALMIRTLVALHAVQPGFDPHHVLTMEMSLTGERFHNTEGLAELTRHGLDRLRVLPGVEAAAAGFWLPDHVDDALSFVIAGEPEDPDHWYGSKWMSITPGYLSAFHISLLRGRDFTEADVAGAPKVALINEALARKYFPHEDPVGRQITTSKYSGPEMEEATRTIVGVIADTRNRGLSEDAAPMVIAPIVQVSDQYTKAYADVQPLFWVVRTHGDPHASVATVTDELRAASGGFTVAHVRTMDEVMGRSTDRERFNMLLLTIFGVIALVLAAIGIYGLMAYLVAQRHREMGIRMALGADRARIRNLVVLAGMKMAIAGIVLGVVAALGLTRLMVSFLFGVRASDPAAFIAGAAILSAVTLLAVWLPGLRASRVDPARALRAD